MTEELDDNATASGEGFSVSDALAMFEAYKSEWSENYRQSKIDLMMYVGDQEAHYGDGWDSSFTGLPKGKPCIVINELPQFVHQVCNDIRQNTPSIKVFPDSDGDQETAEVISELVRAIEYKSKADAIYDTAAEYASSCAIGFIRLDHQYVDDQGDEQEIILKRVCNPLATWIDPSSVECDGSDAMGGITLDTLSEKEFKRTYPKAECISFDNPTAGIVKDTVTIAEIYVKTWDDDRQKTATVRRYKFSGKDLLEETVFPSKYIPLVPVYGKETWVDGKRVLQSLIRQARQPQRRLNYLASKEAEILALAPIAPILAVEGTLVNERNQYQNAGSEAYLEYRTTDLDGNPAPAPTRLAPPPASTGVMQAIQQAKESIKEVMGLYNASIGQRSNETSGVAINARKVEGDIATLHFADNLKRSITQVGVVMLDMMPKVYDTARVLQVVSAEEEPRSIGLNGGEMQEGQEKPFDIRQGTYNVRVATGASYTTKRQEAAQFLADMFRQSPELMAIGGDLLFKNLDLPGAEALAERFKKTIDPKLLEDNGQDPRIQQMQMAMQQMQGQLQQAMQALQSKQGEEAIKAAELQVKQGELQLKEAELKVKIMELQKPPEGKGLEVNQQLFDQQIKEREIALKEAEFQLKVTQALQSQQVQESQLQNMQPLAQETAGASSNQETTQFAG